MIFRTIFGLFSILIVCACNQLTSKNVLQEKKEPYQQIKLKSGLKIEYKPTRGMPHIDPYTDSLGTKYQLRHIPIIITNNSTIPIHTQIAFSKEYEYPIAFGNEHFKVIPLPKE